MIRTNPTIFQPSIFQSLFDIYKEKIFQISDTLQKPSPIYTLRVNTLKSDADTIIKEAKKDGLKLKKYHYKGIKIPEIIYYKPLLKRRKIKRLKKTIQVDKFAAESISQGANLYRPGVKKWTRFDEKDIISIIFNMNGAEIVVANAQAMTSSKRIAKSKKGIVAKNVKSLYNGVAIHDLNIFKKGYIYNQSLPTIITSRILNPETSDFIIDLCAAPGGKTTHLAQLMNNKGKILAIDRSDNKIQSIKTNLNRLGVKNVSLKNLDSTKLEGLKANKILIDPPCSGLGIRPTIIDYTTIKDVNNLATYQKKFLHAAVRNIESGGLVVYSTCTLTLEENEMNVHYMIKKLGCKIDKQSIFIGNPGFSISNNDSLKYTQRFSPIKNKCPGFFIAKLKAP
ncbi:MAG: methyltransferase domain-containing protein [Candidatus Lokiarchaeota archaeon]|nr:methyltransferase domain-containing protein [Candidatus Lokiarchaeota archaeon]